MLQSSECFREYFITKLVSAFFFTHLSHSLSLSLSLSLFLFLFLLYTYDYIYFILFSFQIVSSFVRDLSYHDMYYKGCGLLTSHKKFFNTAIPVRSLGPYMCVHYCTMYNNEHNLYIIVHCTLMYKLCTLMYNVQ